MTMLYNFCAICSTPLKDFEEEIPRKKMKIAVNVLSNVGIATSTRERRSAFKRCTEWFKHLTGEIQDKFSCPTCNKGFASKRKMKEHELIHKSVEPPKINQKVVHHSTKSTKTREEIVYHNGKPSNAEEQPIYQNIEPTETTSNEPVHQSNKSTKTKHQAGNPTRTKEQVVERSTKPPRSNDKNVEALKVMAERFESQIGELECEECHEVFSSKSGLSRHQRRHGEALFHCKKCHARFFSQKTLLSHMQHHLSGRDLFHGKVRRLRTAVSRIRKFKCNECDARFAQQWSLEQHEVIHTRSNEDFDCRECGQKFNSVSLLAKHLESHAGQKSYGCGECDLRFKQKSALFKHQLTHVDVTNGQRNVRKNEPKNEARKADCTECKMQFTDRSELKIHHLAVHGTENLCVCTQCNKCFSKQASLRRHLLTHADEKAFKCSICEEIFAQKSTLTRHALLHGGEQFYRFTCSVCDRKFSRRETLTDHMRTHTGERPFVCAVCHEGFTQKSAMRRHQILHFKERRGKRFPPPEENSGSTQEDVLLSLVYSTQK